MADKFSYKNRFWHCKHGNFCRYQHFTPGCENSSCIIIICDKCHTRYCYWFNKYKRCKRIFLFQSCDSQKTPKSCVSLFGQTSKCVMCAGLQSNVVDATLLGIIDHHGDLHDVLLRLLLTLTLLLLLIIPLLKLLLLLW